MPRTKKESTKAAVREMTELFRCSAPPDTLQTECCQTEQRDEVSRDKLEVHMAVEIFIRDPAERDIALRLDAAALGAPGTPPALSATYPEPVPRGDGVSVFDY